MTAKRGLDSICTSDTIHDTLDTDWTLSDEYVNSLASVERRTRRYDDTPKERATRTRALTMALRGNQVSHTQFVDPRKPYCDNPIPLQGRTDPRKEGRTLETNQFVPCRKCAKCLQFRQMQWRERALNEIAKAPRSWFVTLTFSPHHLAGILAESRNEKGNRTQKVDAAAYRHVQKYLKRIRKAGKTRFRYLGVFEEGEKTGRPHYHLLLHEVGPRPVLKRTLEAQWRSFVHCRLVAEEGTGSASYITKYATKTIDVRPRASTRYGK